MSKFKHFCFFERQRIEKLLKQNKSRRGIAMMLDRGVSSVVDEIKRNTVNGQYRALKADHKAYVKRKYSKVQCLKVA
ncbi:MAG: helix-turn-helix domain-containing protein, partial [Candidatus Vogelbacteria bacterium]|nr:helix-turn-helix domain-containing protein [Candidatus Vogelbacteria bacterium]